MTGCTYLHIAPCFDLDCVGVIVPIVFACAVWPTATRVEPSVRSHRRGPFLVRVISPVGGGKWRQGHQIVVAERGEKDDLRSDTRQRQH